MFFDTEKKEKKMKKRKKFLRCGLSCVLALSFMVPANLHAIDTSDVTPPSTATSNSASEAPTSTSKEAAALAENVAPKTGVAPDVNSATSIGNPPSSRNADITKPVIEKIEFPDNGKAVKAGSNVPIYVTAYDADSGIASVNVHFSFDKTSQGTSLYLTYNSETKRYEANLPVSIMNNTKMQIDDIRVVDNSGNYVENQMHDENYNPLYWCSIIGGQQHEIQLSSQDLVFNQNQQTLKLGDKVSFKINLPKEISNQLDSLSICISHKTKNGITYNSLYVSKESGDVYTGTMGNNLEEGQWKFENIEATDTSGKYSYDIQYPDKDSIWFMAKQSVKEDAEAPVITSVNMSKQGEMLTAGDVVTLHIKAKDNKELKYSNAYAGFSAAEDIDQSFINVPLTYNKNTDEYVGSFTVKDTTYPCEWHLSHIDISDMAGNYADNSFVQGGSMLFPAYPYYFNVKNSGTFVNPTYNVDLSFSALDSEGNYKKISTFKKDKVSRRTTLKEAGLKLPSITTTYKGLKFEGWVDYYGHHIDENTPILSDISGTGIYAAYDKRVLTFNCIYPTTGLELKSVPRKMIFDRNATYGNVLSKVNDMNFTDLYKGNNFTGWEYRPSYSGELPDLNEAIGNTRLQSLSFEAGYKDKIVVGTEQDYFKVDGRANSTIKAKFVDKDTTRSSIENELKSQPAPDSFKGLRFKDWTVYGTDESAVSNYDIIHIFAEYENCMVRFLLSPRNEQKSIATKGAAAGPDWDKNFAYVYPMVAEKGETIKVPELPYKNIEWLGNFKPEGNNLIIKNDVDFAGYGDKIDTPAVPDKPSKPSKPVEPNNPSKPVEPNNTSPAIKPTTDVISNAIESIDKASVGQTIQVDMGDANVLPKEVLEGAKGKDVNIKVNMGGYSWTINGKDIFANDLKDINLEVTFHSNAIPSNVIKDLAGNNPVQQISLTHQGAFGFKASLSFAIGAQYQGKFGNLYYYDSDGKMVFMNAGKIDSNGNVSLSFSHASDYAIVIKDKADLASTNSSVNTGDTTNGYVFAGSMLLAFIVLCGVYCIRRKVE